MVHVTTISSDPEACTKTYTYWRLNRWSELVLLQVHGLILTQLHASVADLSGASTKKKYSVVLEYILREREREMSVCVRV